MSIFEDFLKVVSEAGVGRLLEESESEISVVSEAGVGGFLEEGEAGVGRLLEESESEMSVVSEAGVRRKSFLTIESPREGYVHALDLNSGCSQREARAVEEFFGRRTI